MSIHPSLATPYTQQDQPFTLTLPGWVRGAFIDSLNRTIDSAQTEPERGLICPKAGHVAELRRRFGEDTRLEILKPSPAISMTLWRYGEWLRIGLRIAPPETLRALDRIGWAGLIDGGVLDQWITRDPGLLASLIDQLPPGGIGIAAASLLDGIRQLWRHAVDARLPEPACVALLQPALTAAARHAQADGLFIYLASAEAAAYRPNSVFLRALAALKVPAPACWQAIRAGWPAPWQAAAMAAMAGLASANGPITPEAALSELLAPLRELAEPVFYLRHSQRWHPWFADCLRATSDPAASWGQLVQATARAQFIAQWRNFDDPVITRARDACAWLDALADQILALQPTDTTLRDALVTYRAHYDLRQFRAL